MIAKSGSERFVYDAYRRLIMMYADVVMEKAAGIEPKEGMGIRLQLEKIMAEVKKKNGYASDTDLTADDLKDMCDVFKKKVKDVIGKAFPDDPMDQLWGGIHAVFSRGTASARQLPPHRGHPGRVGHRRQRSGDGLRQHGRRLCCRRGVLT